MIDRPPNKSLEPAAAVLAVGSLTQFQACGYSGRGSALDRYADDTTR
jgi:hypothetical protein